MNTTYAKEFGGHTSVATNGNSASTHETIRAVYQEIAPQYDERIPGFTPNDERFTETELRFILDRVQPTDDVLDMGCGTGRFTLPLAEHARSVTGLDLSAAMIAQAGAKAKQRKLQIDFYESDMAHMPFEDQSFDVITCMLALMHIPFEDRQQVFLEASRVLKPGGRMVIGVKNALFERFCRVDRFASVDITDVDAGQLIFTQTQSGTDLSAPWLSFSPQDLQRLFALAGLHVVDLRGNTPLSAWIADPILADPTINHVISVLEQLLGDMPPLNYWGYHILVEAIKPF